MQDADGCEDCDKIDEPSDDEFEEEAYVCSRSFNMLAGRRLSKRIIDTEPVEDFGDDSAENSPEDPADDENDDCCNEVW